MELTVMISVMRLSRHHIAFKIAAQGAHLHATHLMSLIIIAAKSVLHEALRLLLMARSIPTT